MEYLTFNRKTNELFYRDNLTTFIDRVSFKVVSFTKTDVNYIFDLEEHPKLKLKQIYFPIHNTVLSII